jgi:hypothetical protein
MTDLALPPSTPLTGAKKVIAFIVMGTVSILSIVGAFSPTAREYVVSIINTLLPALSSIL